MGLRPALGLAALALGLGAPALAQDPPPPTPTLRIVAFGDSITVGEIGDTPGGGGYPARLQALLTSENLTVTVVNAGKSGETTVQGLSRITSIDGGPDDVLLVMEGTNDIFQDISPQSIAANLINIGRRGRTAGFGRVAIATIIPIGRTTTPGRTDDSENLAAEIRQSTWAADFEQADPNRVLRDQDNLFETLYISDNIHPNPDGYDLLAEAFADFIDDLDTVAPAWDFVQPEPDDEDVSPDALLQVVLFDAESGVDQSTATLTVNGSAVATTVSGEARRTVLQARPGGLVGRPALGVDVRDREIPANRRQETVSRFTIEGATFFDGDLDLSGRVDGIDLVFFGRAFGARSGTTRYLPLADIDDNGTIDGADLARLASNFGLSSF